MTRACISQHSARHTRSSLVVSCRQNDNVGAGCRGSHAGNDIFPEPSRSPQTRSPGALAPAMHSDAAGTAMSLQDFSSTLIGPAHPKRWFCLFYSFSHQACPCSSCCHLLQTGLELPGPCHVPYASLRSASDRYAAVCRQWHWMNGGQSAVWMIPSPSARGACLAFSLASGSRSV